MNAMMQGEPSKPPTKAVGLMMRSPDIMSDVEVIAELAKITEEHFEHDVPLTPDLIRKVKQNTWFESDDNHRHYILINGNVRIAISCHMAQNHWIPCSTTLVIDEVSHTTALTASLKTNVIAARILAANIPKLLTMFSFIIDNAPPGGIAMTKLKHSRITRRPRSKH